MLFNNVMCYCIDQRTCVPLLLYKADKGYFDISLKDLYINASFVQVSFLFSLTNIISFLFKGKMYTYRLSGQFAKKTSGFSLKDNN